MIRIIPLKTIYSNRRPENPFGYDYYIIVQATVFTSLSGISYYIYVQATGYRGG